LRSYLVSNKELKNLKINKPINLKTGFEYL